VNSQVVAPTGFGASALRVTQYAESAGASRLNLIAHLGVIEVTEALSTHDLIWSHVSRELNYACVCEKKDACAFCYVCPTKVSQLSIRKNRGEISFKSSKVNRATSR